MRGTGRSRARLGDGFPDATGFRRQQDNDHPSCYSLACPSAIFMLRGGLRAHDDWGEESEGGRGAPPSELVLVGAKQQHSIGERDDAVPVQLELVGLAAMSGGVPNEPIQ